MAALVVGAVMDAIANTAKNAGVTQRVYAWPNDAIQVPALVVGYPEKIDFDAVFGRGSDLAEFPVWIVCGRATERTTRDVVSAYITGATGVKNALDGTLGGVVQTCRVTDCQLESVHISGVEMLAAKFTLEVYS